VKFGLRKASSSYGSTQLNELARDIQQGFDAILDQTTHRVTVVYDPPFKLAVPFFGGLKRQKAPDFVSCMRAVNLTDNTILVTPGTCSFEWLGDGLVRVDAVAGLTTGQKYQLVFQAVG
jgi:hypothetical protein